MTTSLRLTALIPILALAVVHTAAAQTSALKGSLHVSLPAVTPGQRETVTVVAHDASGHAVRQAWGQLAVTYGRTTVRYPLPVTNQYGTTHVTFVVPPSVRPSRVSLQAHLTDGAGAVTVAGTFAVRRHVSTKTAAPPLQISVRVEPQTVTAPQPAWLVITAHSYHGAARAAAPVDAEVMLPQGALHLSGSTDDQGVSTLRIDTSSVTGDGPIEVGVVVRSGNDLGMGSAQLLVHAAPAPTSTPMPSFTPTPAATAVPTIAPAPTPTSTLVPTPTWTPQTSPTFQPTSTPAPLSTEFPTAAPTFTPYVVDPTFTPTPFASGTPAPYPTDTSVPFPTNTPLPFATDTPVPTQMPFVTDTPVPSANCPGSNQGCIQAMMNLMNQSRATYAQQYGLRLNPLQLNMGQSMGNASCVGSIGHSQAMAASGSIWHVNSSYPQASFPNDICGRSFSAIGENVGVASNGDEMTSLTTIHQEMMSEQHDPSTCAQYTDHACSIVSSTYTNVGVGIVVTAGGATYLTEDFSG